MDKRASLLQWFAATAEAKLKAVQDYLRLIAVLSIISTRHLDD